MCHLLVSQINESFQVRNEFQPISPGVFALEKPHSNSSAFFFLQEECLPFVLTTHCSFLNAFPMCAVWVFCLFFSKTENLELICEMIFELPNRN